MDLPAEGRRLSRRFAPLHGARDLRLSPGAPSANRSVPEASPRTRRRESDWKVEPTVIQRGASIGSGATILARVTLGKTPWWAR